MGGKGPRTRSVKRVPGQSWRCVPNQSRTGRESRSSTIKATRGRVRTPKAFAKRIRRFWCISHAVLWSAMRPRIAFELYGSRNLRENCLRESFDCHRLQADEQLRAFTK